MARGPGGVSLGDERPPVPARVEALFGPQRASPPLPGEPLPEPLRKPERVFLPPHFFSPPSGAQAFFPFGSADVAGPAVQWVVPADIIYNVPQTHVAIVRSVGLAVRNVLATTDIRAQLRAGNAPLAPVFRFPAQPVAYLERVWDSYAYVIPPGTKLDVMVTVADAGLYPVTAYYEGWIMSADDWARYLGERA